MSRVALTVLVLCFVSGTVIAQTTGPGGQTATLVTIAEDRARLAMINADYPVTPGDLYRLTYQQGSAPPSSWEILVGGDYVIQLNVFGKLNAAGMTFVQVKQTIEKAFAAAYPRSVPSVAISSVGRFRVSVTGEAPEAKNVDAWGMSRLNEIVEGNLGPYSSLRDVRVISSDGSEKHYDLFKYERSGVTDQNPLVKPGDRVVIAQAQRTVEIAGEIRRPGKYQPLSSDQLGEMILSYGGGLTAAAETSHVRIDRVSGDKASTLYVKWSANDASPVVLQDGDIVTVPSKIDDLPMVFFEGAVTPETPQRTVAAATPQTTGLLPPVGYNRIPYSFRQGETLKGAFLSLRKSVSPDANLSGAFLVREGVSEPIPVDLTALLLGGSTASDPLLQSLDRIVIPTAQFSVAVYGDVARPGNYPYTPSKTYRHYADLAGFGDIEEVPENILIIDSRGKRRSIKELIEPGSRLYLTAARVTVQGAVLNPGNFPYRADFSVSDYENQAGGFDPVKSTNSKVTVYDSKGKERKQGTPLQPGDRIYVHSDSFGYNFNQNLPIVLSLITAVSTVITIYALVR